MVCGWKPSSPCTKNPRSLQKSEKVQSTLISIADKDDKGYRAVDTQKWRLIDTKVTSSVSVTKFWRCFSRRKSAFAAYCTVPIAVNAKTETKTRHRNLLVITFPDYFIRDFMASSTETLKKTFVICYGNLLYVPKCHKVLMTKYLYQFVKEKLI